MFTFWVTVRHRSCRRLRPARQLWKPIGFGNDRHFAGHTFQCILHLLLAGSDARCHQVDHVRHIGVEVAQGTILRLREAEERLDLIGYAFTASPTRPTADWMPDTMPSMMSEPHFRASAGRDVIQSMAAWMPVTMASRTLPIVALMPSSRLPAASRILSQFFRQQNADCDCSGDCQNDRAEGAGKNRDYRTDHLDNGDDALYNNKGQLNNGNDRFHNRNNGCNHAKDSRDALDRAMTATTPTAILPMDSPDVCPFFLSTFPLDNSLKN